LNKRKKRREGRKKRERKKRRKEKKKKKKRMREWEDENPSHASRSYIFNLMILSKWDR
jgi:hypothetical protein